MLIINATMHPHGSAAGAYEILHGTVTNLGTTADGEIYGAHLMHRPNAERGIDGWEADVRVGGYNSRLGLGPLLSGILSAIEPIPFEHEAQVDVQRKLTLKDLDAFDARIRGGSR